jgi:hypothetical protein
MSSEKIRASTESDLNSALAQFVSPSILEMWGAGKAKTITHLLTEMQEGECMLETSESPDGTKDLIRRSQGVGLYVYYIEYDDDGTPLKAYKLFEDEQIFLDEKGQLDHKRTKKRNLPTSVNEKLKKRETVEGTAIRVLRDELKITAGFRINWASRQRFTKSNESISYPGLVTVYDFTTYNCFLDGEAYNPDGYIEQQDDKWTFFKWKEIDLKEVE